MKLTDYGEWVYVNLYIDQQLSGAFWTRDMFCYNNRDFLNKLKSDGYDAVWAKPLTNGKTKFKDGWFIRDLY